MRSCWSSAARIRETAVSICGSKNGSLSELRRGRRKFSTSSAQRNPFRESNRAMHSDPQISLHAIAPPFSYTEFIRASYDSAKLLLGIVLVVDQQFRITHNVNKQDVCDFQREIRLRLSQHIRNATLRQGPLVSQSDC